MPDQTPEVCAECGHDELGNLEHQEWLPFDEKPRGHPFRSAEPTPAERPEGVEWRRVGEVGHGEVHWRIDSRDIDAVVSVSLERAISSAAVAEGWCTGCRTTVTPNSGGGHTIPGSMPDNCGPVELLAEVAARAEAAERALEEAREAAWAALADIGWGHPALARLRALVSTDGEEGARG